MVNAASTVVFVSNAIDDKTRSERAITTDSPAATKKVFALSGALSRAGVRSVVLSLGRGRQDGSGRYFKARAGRASGVATLYAPFLNLPGLSELFTLFGVAPLLARAARPGGSTLVLFYNRAPAYLIALIFARLKGMRCALDLEDGELKGKPVGVGTRLIRWAFDSLCSAGAVVACRSLAEDTAIRPVMCCYGVVDGTRVERDFHAPILSVLFGGTVSESTGADILIDAISRIRESSAEWATQLRFEITGKGDRLAAFADIADDDRAPRVIMHGRTTRAEYERVLRDAQVGLALKPNSGPLADTTFPSKVVELAGANVLTLTTDISDVREVLGDGALYLTSDDPAKLVDLLRWVAEHRADASAIADKGAERVALRCSPLRVGRELCQVLLPAATSTGLNS